MQELKFEVTIPAAQMERLIQSVLIKELGLSIPGIKVKLEEKFVPSDIRTEHHGA